MRIKERIEKEVLNSADEREACRRGYRLAIEALRERADDVEPHSYTACRVIREEADYLESLLESNNRSAERKRVAWSSAYILCPDGCGAEQGEYHREGCKSLLTEAGGREKR